MNHIKDLPPLKETISTFGLNAEKSLGQHFLLDLNLTDKIARKAGDLTNSTVIEIGPGPGGLTRSLLASGAKQVIAIERDSRCVTALQTLQDCSQGRLTIIEEDALQVDETVLIKHYAPNDKIKIIANLPYNISTALLTKWLDQIELYDSLTLMFQKEVADRIIAAPGSKAYGRLSVLSGWLCERELLFDIPAQAFVPPPKVVSSVVTLTPRSTPLAEANKHTLQTIVKTVFGQRRKMIRASLKSLTDKPEKLLEETGISPEARPETLSIEEFCTLARAYDKK